MVASIATALQFVLKGEVLFWHAVYFGLITIASALCGLKAINIYVARSGRQSIIAIVLTAVLALALVSLPVKYLIFYIQD